MYRVWTKNDEIDLPTVPMLRETIGVSFHVRGRRGRRVVNVEAPNLFGGLRKLYHEVNARENGWEILGYQMIRRERHHAFANLADGSVAPERDAETLGAYFATA